MFPAGMILPIALPGASFFELIPKKIIAS